MIAQLLPLLLIACETKSEDTEDTQTPVENSNDCEWDECYGDCMVPVESTETFSVEPDVFANYIDAEGNLSEDQCAALCDYQFDRQRFRYVYEVLECQQDGPDTELPGNELITCTAQTTYYCEGRLHNGSSTASCEDSVGSWCARAAHNETVSVASFAKLHRSLSQLGAPQSLLTKCLSAASDEIRHARQMVQLAKQHQAPLPALQFGDSQPCRVELAIDNVVEGCVKETFAALIALHQAKHAQNNEIRQAMKTIAQDELQHAQLAMDIHEWLLAQLTETEKAQVAEAKLQALTELEASWKNRFPNDIDSDLGRPNPAKGLALARAFHNALAA